MFQRSAARGAPIDAERPNGKLRLLEVIVFPTIFCIAGDISRGVISICIDGKKLFFLVNLLTDEQIGKHANKLIHSPLTYNVNDRSTPKNRTDFFQSKLSRLVQI